jgi:hypothetical protein
MRSLWTSLLFLHGYVADPQLALRLAGEEPADASASPPPPRNCAEAMRSLLDGGRRLSLRLCQGIGSGLVHMQ